MACQGKRPKGNLQGSGTGAKANKSLSCAQRIEAATVHRTQVSMTEKMIQDAEALFATHDSEGTELLSRGALTELLRQVGLEAKVGLEGFGATARLAFDAHSADSHFLSLPEFKQLYYVVNQRYPELLPRRPFLNIRIYSASGLPPADFNGKSDPFVVVQIPDKPQSKSQTTILEKTLDPVWGKGGIGEEFYDKYAYEEGDNLEVDVLDYDKGQTDFECLGRGILRCADFHKPGGFHGDIQLTCPPDCPKGFHPTLKIKVVVNAIEDREAHKEHALEHMRVASKMAVHLAHHDHHPAHTTPTGADSAPAGA